MGTNKDSLSEVLRNMQYRDSVQEVLNHREILNVASKDYEESLDRTTLFYSEVVNTMANTTIIGLTILGLVIGIAVVVVSYISNGKLKSDIKNSQDVFQANIDKLLENHKIELNSRLNQKLEDIEHRISGEIAYSFSYKEMKYPERWNDGMKGMLESLKSSFLSNQRFDSGLPIIGIKAFLELKIEVLKSDKTKIPKGFKHTDDEIFTTFEEIKKNHRYTKDFIKYGLHLIELERMFEELKELSDSDS